MSEATCEGLLLDDDLGLLLDDDLGLLLTPCPAVGGGTMCVEVRERGLRLGVRQRGLKVAVVEGGCETC